jgi:hypothetical protein
MNHKGIKFTKIEFQMYMENCITKNEKGEVLVIQKPSPENLISFIQQIRKAK